MPARTVMLIGTSTLIAGVATVMLSLWADSPLGFFLETSVAGIGFGAGFQGGIRLVAPPLARRDRGRERTGRASPHGRHATRTTDALRRRDRRRRRALRRPHRHPSPRSRRRTRRTLRSDRSQALHNQVRLGADPVASTACRRGDTHPKYTRRLGSVARDRCVTRAVRRWRQSAERARRTSRSLRGAHPGARSFRSDARPDRLPRRRRVHQRHR